MKTEVKYLGNTEGELFTSWHYVLHGISTGKLAHSRLDAPAQAVGSFLMRKS